MGKLKTSTPGHYQHAVRLVVPDISWFPTPEWTRTLIVHQSGEAMIPAGLVGMDSQYFLDQTEQEDVNWALVNDRLYFPLRWVASKRPELAPLWILLQQAIHEALADEVKRRGE